MQSDAFARRIGIPGLAAPSRPERLPGAAFIAQAAGVSTPVAAVPPYGRFYAFDCLAAGWGQGRPSRCSMSVLKRLR